MVKSSLPADQVTEATVSFSKMEDALQQVRVRLQGGLCVMAWPVEGAGFRVAAWGFENDTSPQGGSGFAPTVPQGLEDLTRKP